MEHTLEMLFRQCYSFLYYFVLNSLNYEGLGAGTEHAIGVREAELCLNSTLGTKTAVVLTAELGMEYVETANRTH